MMKGKGPQGLNTDTRGSSLIALARTATLPTRAPRAGYERIVAHCIGCRRETETILHIIIKFGSLRVEAEELARPDRPKPVRILDTGTCIGEYPLSSSLSLEFHDSSLVTCKSIIQMTEVLFEEYPRSAYKLLQRFFATKFPQRCYFHGMGNLSPRHEIIQQKKNSIKSGVFHEGRS